MDQMRKVSWLRSSSMTSCASARALVCDRVCSLTGLPVKVTGGDCQEILRLVLRLGVRLVEL
ncbi:hypothetical protein GJAV_G00016870 [Gymnothorax javanicus]|nr:hypothetical protein GJAV_G00016870 [Gymnothorax javanicus]